MSTVKFIDYWMFASHLWNDAKPTPVAINVRDITRIEQITICGLGENIVAVYLKSNQNPIPIEGDIIDVLAELQKHLSTMY